MSSQKQKPIWSVASDGLAKYLQITGSVNIYKSSLNQFAIAMGFKTENEIENQSIKIDRNRKSVKMHFGSKFVNDGVDKLKMG